MCDSNDNVLVQALAAMPEGTIAGRQSQCSGRCRIAVQCQCQFPIPIPIEDSAQSTPKTHSHTQTRANVADPSPTRYASQKRQVTKLLVLQTPPHSHSPLNRTQTPSHLLVLNSISQQLRVGRRQQPPSVRLVCARAVGELQRSGSVSRWRPDNGAPCQERRGRPARHPHIPLVHVHVHCTVLVSSVLLAVRRALDALNAPLACAH